MEQNKIETHDDYVSLGNPTFEDSFYDLGTTHTFVAYKPSGHFEIESLFGINFYLSDQYKKHTRKIYNLIDLLGDMGGVLEISTAFFGLFIFPISRFSFLVKALQLLFLVRTKEKGIF